MASCISERVLIMDIGDVMGLAFRRSGETLQPAVCVNCVVLSRLCISSVILACVGELCCVHVCSSACVGELCCVCLYVWVKLAWVNCVVERTRDSLSSPHHISAFPWNSAMLLAPE